MLSKMVLPVTIFAFSLSAFGIILGWVSINILNKVDGKRQNLFLLHIQIISILHNFAFIFLWTMFCFEMQWYEERAFIAATCFYWVLILGIFGLTIDRFLTTFKPFSYKRLVTDFRIKLYILCTWIISITIRIPFIMDKLPLHYLVKIDVTVELLCLLIQPFVYLYIYLSWRRRTYSSQISDSLNHGHNKKLKESDRHFLIVTVCIFLISCVEAVTDLMYAILNLDILTGGNIYSFVGIVFWMSLVTFAPFIYVAVKPNVAEYMRAKLRGVSISKEIRRRQNRLETDPPNGVVLVNVKYGLPEDKIVGDEKPAVIWVEGAAKRSQ